MLFTVLGGRKITFSLSKVTDKVNLHLKKILRSPNGLKMWS